MENVSIIVILLFVITCLGVLSNKYKFPFPIILVLSGVIISLIPRLPVITLNPDVVFVIFLPPLLYSGAWNTSWHEFKAAITPISLASVGLVLLTTVFVAIAAHLFIPGLTWPLSFLLGAIVSPPDAIAATSVTKGLGLTPRILTILEGESLVNDASGLITYKYALIAVTAGNFILWQASLNFLWLVGAGIAVGIAIGYCIYIVHKKFICDPLIVVTLTFITPFTSYLIAEHFHVSGVLAVVSTGLYLSFRSDKIFSNQSRIMAYTVWEVITFILNSLVFILIGLQLRTVMKGISDYPVDILILYGLIISFVVIAVRFIWAVPAAMLPHYLLNKRKRDTPPPDPRNMIIFAWSGMRGVVSMAAALALPLTLKDGSAFPQRNLIIYLSFCVILSTLVVLGLTLPWIIRKLKLEPYSVVMEEYDVRTRIVTAAISYIEESASLVSDDLLNNIKSKYEIKYNRLQKTDLPPDYFKDGHALQENVFNQFSKMQIDLIGVERKTLQQLHRSGKASEQVLRKIERELDLEETRLQMEMYATVPF
ncbi:MAG: Na+/H+ antiporter [Ilyomonas sp.]